MSTNHIILAVLALMCVLLIIGLAGNSRSTVSETETESLNPVETTTAILTPEGEYTEPVREPISETTIEELYLGYTYEQIEEMFGYPADERESEYCRDKEGYTAPFTIVWYTWENPDNTKIRLGFINNKLERKHFIRRDGNVISNEVDLGEIQ